MPNTQVVGAAKSFGLDQLNAWIREREKLMGPIVEIEDGGSKTAGVFDLSKPRLKTGFAFASLKVGGACVAQSGAHALICEGHAFIAGTLQPVCVWR